LAATPSERLSPHTSERFSDISGLRECRRQGTGLMRETAKDGFAGRDLDEMEDGQRKQDKNGIREPWVQSSEVEPVRNMISVKQLEDIEMEKVETVTTLANKQKGTPGKERRDKVWAAEAENKSSEDGGEKATVHEQVGGVEDDGVEEEAYPPQADSG
jgi:hypothetical protein